MMQSFPFNKSRNRSKQSLLKCETLKNEDIKMIKSSNTEIFKNFLVGLL